MIIHFYILAILYYILINVMAAFWGGVKDSNRIGIRAVFYMIFGGCIGELIYAKRKKIQIPKKKLIVTAITFVFLHVSAAVFFVYQDNHLVDTFYTYDSNDDIDVRIVQVSDLHNNILWFDKDYVADNVKKLKPDIIVITGDIVDSTSTQVDRAIYAAGKLAEIADTYYVTGNHEMWLEEDKIDALFDGLRSKGVHVLIDEYEIIEGYGDSFALIGVDDGSLMGDSLRNMVKEIDERFPQITKIALCHEPQFINNYAFAGPDLVITGHVHGGQFILPGIGPVFAPSQGFRPQYSMGEYIEKNTTMIVSRGIGNSLFPVRLFNYPEVVCIDIN